MAGLGKARRGRVWQGEAGYGKVRQAWPITIQKKGIANMVYQYSWSGPERAVSAEKVGNHIRQLEKRYGEVTRETFLESARPADSPMHCLFEWDDTVAAEKYRLYQANVIIASLRVTITEEKKEPVILRGYVQDRKTSSGYLNIERAMTEQDKRKRVLEQAKRELKWFVEKYAAFEELAKIMAAISEYLE